MWTWMTAILCILVFFFFLMILSQVKLKLIIEWVSFLPFKIAVAFLMLFILNVVCSFAGVAVPVNIFSAVTVALLGVPGLLCVGVINLFL